VLFRLLIHLLLTKKQGFAIFSSDPLKERFRRSKSERSIYLVCSMCFIDFIILDFDGGLGYVEMLFKCNILAFVGGGREPLYPRNKVMLWDDYQVRHYLMIELISAVTHLVTCLVQVFCRA